MPTASFQPQPLEEVTVQETQDDMEIDSNGQADVFVVSCVIPSFLILVFVPLLMFPFLYNAIFFSVQLSLVVPLSVA